jgi:hypothetical protein
MAFLRKFGLRGLVASGLSILSASMAHGFVTYHSSERAKSASSAYVPASVTVDTQALFGDASTEQSKSAKRLTLQLPSGKRYNVTRARILPGLDGGKTFVGYFDSHGEDYRIYVTETQGAISGVMLSPEGSMELGPLASNVDGNVFFTSHAKAGRTRPFSFESDASVPPPSEAAALARLASNSTAPMEVSALDVRAARDRAKAGTQVTVDILVAYTAGMVTRYNNAAGVTSRLNTLVALTNDALILSAVNLTIRLVNASQVNYSEVANNADSLNAISPGSTDPLKATVDALRDLHKADLVVLIRPYDSIAHARKCGQAWILGYGGTGVSASDAEYGFSSVGDGADVSGGTGLCGETTLAHELGHNFGLVHDRISQPGITGATSFGRGFIVSPGVGTIMAEGITDVKSRLFRFSNPNTVCSSVPCGVARTDTAMSADAAGAILTTMDAIAAFRTSVIVDPNADSDADGIPNGIEAIESRQANVKDNAIFAGMVANSDRLFSMQQYRDFLGREGDVAGIAHWTNLLSTKALTREQVIKNFFDSQEFQNGVPTIVRLYLGYFKRIPDHDGLFGWVGIYRGGQTLKNISDAFSGSAEFQQTYGALSNTQFVTLVYRNVLDRAPDQAGLDAWLAFLGKGASRGEVMAGFTESEEFRNKTANSVEVIMMYEGMLRRAAEPAGLTAWLNYLNAGNTSIPLISGFLNSAEYRTRFLP